MDALHRIALVRGPAPILKRQGLDQLLGLDLRIAEALAAEPA